jgi:ribose transport system permease protein
MSGDMPRIWMAFAAAICVWSIAVGFEGRVASYVGTELTFSTILPLGAAAMSEMFIIVIGDIDISIGFFIGLANAVAARFLVPDPLWGALLLVALVAAYMLMGVLIQVLTMPALLGTLAASFIWEGIGLALYPMPGGTAPQWLLSLYNSQPPFVPFPIIALAVLAVPTTWYIRRTRQGALLRGFGSDPRATATFGISALKMRLIAYGLAGVFGVIGGLAVTAISNSASPTSSAPLTLLAIAAAIVGGSEFSGGFAVPVGAILGAIAVSLATTVLTFVNVPSNYQDAVVGLILLGALTLRMLVRRVER